MILLSCAKTMASKDVRPNKATPVMKTSSPRWMTQSAMLVNLLHNYSAEELGEMLHVNEKLALLNRNRLRTWGDESALHYPAVEGYTGIVFKQLGVQQWDETMQARAQQDLRLTSFMYGLLRPYDLIFPYRLEGDVQLHELEEKNLFHFWRQYLTDQFIADIQASGGTLVYLASNEMRGLFDWKRITEAVRVVTPEFLVYKENGLKQIVVYTKMARGQLTRWILEHPERALTDFQWEGYGFDEELTSQRQSKATPGEQLLTFVL